MRIGLDLDDHFINWLVGVICSNVPEGIDVGILLQVWHFGEVGGFGKSAIDTGTRTGVKDDGEIDGWVGLGAGKPLMVIGRQ